MEIINLVQLTDNNGKDWENAIKIYNEAFPAEERRPAEQHAQLLKNDPSYCFYIIKNESDIIGILITWKLDGVIFMDYLATISNTRNKGYGKKIVQKLQSISEYPIILEVELPDNELAQRRIGFYERLGFSIVDTNFFIPKFNNPGEKLPMYLMSFPSPINKETAEIIIKEIHSKIYGLK
ncbi:MAG: GNAT family N-acetyltransferase [Bacteroidales bacterium]|jgi:ribosomal protein S18 acetylase RimI-like enzyme|nr:GNAT family N-acetyltransferase [Bacteroidales bacterium]